MKAAFMLSGEHDTTHKQLKRHLENAYVIRKEDKYPTDTVDLLSMMNNFRSIGSHTPRQQNQRPGQEAGVDNGVSFLQQGEEDNEGANFIQEGGEQYESQGSTWPYNKTRQKEKQ